MAFSGKNTGYENFFLANEVEDMYTSHLDNQQFCTIDNTLVGTAGMKKLVNVYSSTEGTQKLAVGYGNNKSITVGYTQKEYDIVMAQTRFEYYDEEAMNDPMVVLTGTRRAGVDIFNVVNGDIVAELEKAQIVVIPSSSDYFGAFVDAQAAMNVEANDGTGMSTTFALVKPSIVATLRKAFRDDLKYVESYVRTGYIGTVGGTNLYTSKLAGDADIVVATKEAVTVFNKKGAEVEQINSGNRGASDANVRLNTLFARKYYVAALTDATKAAKIAIGATASVSADTEVNSAKTYYALVGTAYVVVTPADGDNPHTKGWYEISFS